ncbi:Spore germination protein gerPA/gerPF [Oceanobacillus limi]|uniref:Spore germination protein gerPA/gerPF n=1 Tax=Oceanobacillus limi TaxID=930131 RepID=A0A1I0FAM6_9BACI|nr:spore germination protein [Oceanobacillus limi]SET55266.1 Spore germination protein gerPA/gerPF [Oceanobacillus limi]
MEGHTNNIFGIRINSIESNGSLNLGNTWHTSHQVNVKMNVGYYHIGDANNSPLQFNNVNYANDSDIIDQVQKQL